MENQKLFFSRVIVLFTLLFIITIPFPYNVIPKLSSLFLPVFETITSSIGSIFFKGKSVDYFFINSDSLGLYIHTVVLFILSIIVSAFLSIFFYKKPENNSAFFNWFKTSIGYYLSLQLLIYGFDKVFKHQFYLPEPNTLYTPLGYLSKDILYWSTMGSSYSYTFFCGIIEVIAAVFLLFKPTRVFGAIMSIAITTNVIMINFSFDISVKIYSALLLFISIIIAYSFIKKTIHYFFFNATIKPEIRETNNKSKTKYILKHTVKSIVIIIMFAEALYASVVSENYNDDKKDRPLLHGAYDIKYYIKNNDTIQPLLKNSNYIKRFFIHKEGYFITQFMNEEMQDYKFQYDKNKLILKNQDGTNTIVTYKLNKKDSSLVLKTTSINDTIIFVSKKINLQKLPLLQPCFHWTSDEF